MKTFMLTLCPVVMMFSFLASCSTPDNEDLKFEAFAKEYLDQLLQMNPEFATSLGEHRYDDRLSDYSRTGIQAQIQFQRQSVDRLARLEMSKLSVPNRIDYAILQSQIQSALFQLENLREYEWNPLFYNAGNAVYGLTAREFAPLRDRLKSVKARLKAMPAVLEAARANLGNPPRVHTETAILQNKGNISLVREELKTYLDQAPELIPEFASVQKQVIAAFESYGNWLEKDLLPRSNGNFRIGENKFRDKLRYTLDSDLSLEQILERAQSDLQKTQDELYQTARSLSKTATPETSTDAKKRLIREALDRLAESRPSNETVVALAKTNLEEATQFVRQHSLVTVPQEPVKIIVMPEFQRGVAVAYCDSPGPLEKNGETFYSISPTPADWTPARSASFFREYNNFMLKNLTVHEAMPGHYLQLAHSNKYKGSTPIRAIFTSGVFAEGWATYAEQLMVEKGYGGLEAKMQQLKMRLRLIINAVLDQKIHAAGMSEKEAIDLMMNEGFQEEGEAAGKWRRACLSSTQLSTYYVGNTEINEIRKAWEVKKGPISDLKTFHDIVLSFGSPSPKYVRNLLGL